MRLGLIASCSTMRAKDTMARSDAIVLGNGAPKQGSHRLHGGDESVRRRIAAEGEKPWGDVGEMGEMIIRLARPLEGDAEERFEV